VRATVPSSNYEFIINDPNAHYERSELPIFYPNDTVDVTVTCIAHDSIISTPAVRHSAVDVLGWQTLFGNEQALYYARAGWLAYVVLLPGEEIPGDD